MSPLSDSGDDLTPRELARYSRFVRTNAGHRFHVMEAGLGTPTLFLHGGGPGCSAWSDFRHVMSKFSSERQCVLVDMLQFGASDKPAVLGPRWSFHAESLIGLIDALDLKRVDLICNSWGGSAALALAAKFPSRVGSLIVTGSVPTPVLRPVDGGLAVDALRLRGDYYGGSGPSLNKMRELLVKAEWFDGSLLPESTVELRYRQSVDADEMQFALGVPNLRGANQDLTSALGLVKAPVLYLWGRHDPFTAPAYLDELRRLTSGSRIHVIEDTAHHPQEERPDEYHAVATEFLNCRMGRDS